MVDSTTSLREDAGQVLFEVTPLNRDDALYRVREALELYLRLPSTPIDETNSSDIAVHKLAANVFHLKSQLALSAAIVRSQQVSIEAQAITIQMQRDVLEGKLISAATSASDEEAIFGGIVDVLPVEGKGVRINLPQLLRRMREWFQK